MWVLLISGILFGITSFIIIHLLHSNNRYYKDLSELRQNAVAIAERRIRDQVEENLRFSCEMDQIIPQVKVLIQKYLKVQREHEHIHLKSDRITQQNEALTNECFHLVRQNIESEEQISHLRADFEALVQQKVTLQTQYEQNLKTIAKLTERNNELEYAINLESISRIEGLEAQNKLYGAIDDVRRSLTRILSPA